RCRHLAGHAEGCDQCREPCHPCGTGRCGGGRHGMTGGAADLRPASTLLVDHEALRHNLAILREHCGAQFMAVIKANGFNLGATEVAETVLAAGVTWLGVAHIHEALALRADGITAPILAWLIDPYAPIAEALVADVTLS